MKRKIFSVLFTLVLVVSFSLMTAVPVSANGNPYTLTGSTIEVTSLAEPYETQTEEAFNAEPHETVVDAVAFDAQTCSQVVIEGTVSALDLGAGWMDTAYVEIGLRPEATKTERNAGVYLIAYNAYPGDGDLTVIHLQDYTGMGYAEGIITIPEDSDFSYKITLEPSGDIGGTAELEVWVGEVSQGTVIDFDYGYASSWEEGAQGALNEDFSSAYLFYSIIAECRGAGGITYSATVGDITIDDTLYVGEGKQFTTIQDAINFANPDDTISVADGIYAEQIVINESLTLIGESRDDVIIDGSSFTETNIKGIWINSSDVTVKNLTVENFGPQWCYSILAIEQVDDAGGAHPVDIATEGKTLSPLSYVKIENVKFDNNATGPYLVYSQNSTVQDCIITDQLGDGIWMSWGCDDARIIHNEVIDSGDQGIWLGRHWRGSPPVTQNGVIQDNTVNGAREAGIWFAGDGCTIENNEVMNIQGDPGGWNNGAVTLGVNAATSNVVIQYNKIHDNSTYGIGISAASDVTQTHINFNNIYNNIGFGLKNQTGVLVDATNNWWGTVNGPTHEDNTFNVGEQGNAVSDLVDYVPWLDAAYDIGDSFAPVENADTGEQFSSIQAAIDAPETDADNTISVVAGTYAEEITVNKANLTLESETELGAIIMPTSTPANHGAAIYISADGVTVDGFEIDGTTLCNNGIYGWDTSGLTITNNKIHGAVNAWDGCGILLISWGNSGTVYDNLIEGNEIYDTGRMGIMVMDHDGSNYTVTYGNTITGNTVYDVWKMATAWGDHGGGIQFNVAKDCSITNNLVYNVQDGQRGIYMYGSAAGNTIEHNTLRNNPIGIQLWISGEGGSPPIVWGGETATSPQVRYNNIYDNIDGAISSNIEGTPMVMDATNNWWGDASGPNHTSNPDGTANPVSDNVHYSTWCAIEDTDLVTPGYQAPTPMVWGVSTDGTIQEAIEAAQPSDIINVAAGEYNLTAPIAVTESVTITGDIDTPSNVVINAPTTGSDRDCFQVQVSNVIIQGFRMQNSYDWGSGTDGGENGGVMIGNNSFNTIMYEPGLIRDLSHVTVTLCEFDNCSYGVYVYEAGDNITIDYNVLTKVWRPVIFYGWEEDGTWLHTRNNSISHNKMDGTNYPFYVNRVNYSADGSAENRGIEFGHAENPTIDVQGLSITHNEISNYIYNAIILSINGVYGTFNGAEDNYIDISYNIITHTADDVTGYVRHTVEVYGDYVQFSHNKVTDHAWNAFCGLNSHHKVHDNVISNTVPQLDYGHVAAMTVGDDADVYNNTLSGGLTGITLFGNGADVYDNNISGYTSASQDGKGGNGIFLYSGGATGTINIYANDISGCLIGIRDEASPAGLGINFNNIHGNTNYGVYTMAGPDIDAANNWWGDISGPYHATTNPSGTGDPVSDNVHYSTWCAIEDTDLVTPGYQAPTPMVWGVSTDGTIQEAIVDASPNDIINVAAGTYTEAILIDKPLILRGATADVNKNGYTVPADYAWDETVESIINHPNPSVSYFAIVDIVDVDNVTFEGFVVQELNAEGNLNSSLVRVRAQAQAISNIVVRNNIIGPNTNTTAQDGAQGRMGLYIVNNPYSDLYGVIDSTFSGNKIFDCKGNGNNVFIWSSYFDYGADGPASMNGTVIEDNEIYGSHRSGIETAGGFSGLTIRDNKIYGNSGLTSDDPDNLKYGNGILLIRGSSDKLGGPTAAYGPEDLTIENNEIYDNQKSGIYMGPINKNYSITGNNIHDNGWDAIRIDLEGTYWNPTFEPEFSDWSCYDGSTNIVANFNNIYNNTESGVRVVGTPTNDFVFDATNNWWETKAGGLIKKMVSANVDYDPWTGAGVKNSKSKKTVEDEDTVDATDKADTKVLKKGKGTPTITVTEYEDNPGDGAPGGFSSAGKYIDVHLDEPADVTEIEIRNYYTSADIEGLRETSLRLSWWDGTAWIECFPSGVTLLEDDPTYKGYVWAIIGEIDTTPTLADLTGTAFMSMAAPAPTGGGGGIRRAPPAGTTEVREGEVSLAGVFEETVTAASEDGLCTLTIAEGTVGLTEKLEPLMEITMVVMDEPPPPPEDAHIIGLAYDFGPDGATFEPPVSLQFSYDPSAIPEGIAEEDLLLAYYDEEAGEWVELEGCVVDTVTKTITASVEHFSAFAIIAVTPPPPPTLAPTAFTSSSLTISPVEVDIGETVTISVLVANTGEEQGSYTITLKINGVVEETREITLAGGASETVTLATAKDEAGTYSVGVDGLTGSFTVREVALPPPVAPLPTPPPGVNWAMWGPIIGVAVFLAIFLPIRLRRRRT